MQKINRRLEPASLRLALSYLAIIMVLSVSFSFIFYRTSVSSLRLQLQPVTVARGTVDGPALTTPPTGTDVAMGTLEQGGKAFFATGSISDLNQQLQDHINSLRDALIQQLVLLNVGALLAGAILSYYLARKTLQPIEAAVEAQTRFTSDASHELRTPLAVMQAEIEVVLNKPKVTLERTKAALRSNYQEVTRLKQLSEGLLSLTNGAKDDSTFTDIAVDEVVSDAINAMLKAAMNKHITIEDDVPKLTVKGDKSSLVQLLLVLLDNAIKYSPPKTIIRITGSTDDKRVLIAVHDEGPGIRASDLPRIFERFYRADTSRSSQNVSGYGLGLAIAQKIAAQHHGKITVKSTLDKGSTFTIELPV